MARDLDIQLKIKALTEGSESLQDIQNRLKRLQNESKSLENKLKEVGSRFKIIGAGLTVGLTAPLSLFFRNSIKNFDIQAKAVAQVEQGILSTGNAAGISAERFQQLASEIQKNSLFGDEQILQGVTAQLLTFTNIAGDEFERTQQAAADLATRLGGDLQSASIQLGKALNDPVANLSALSRSGIQFSESQKEVINALAKSGRLAEAQGLILDELAKQYGGAAKAAAEAGLGPLTQAANAFSDFTELVGKDLLEIFNPLIQRIRDFIQSLENLNPSIRRAGVVFGLVAAAIGPLSVALGFLLPILPSIAAGFTSIIAAITPFRVAIAAAALILVEIEIRFGIFTDLIRTVSNVFSIFIPTLNQTSDSLQGVGESASILSTPFSSLIRIITNLISLPINGFLLLISNSILTVIDGFAALSKVTGFDDLSSKLRQASDEIRRFSDNRALQIGNILQNGLNADSLSAPIELNLPDKDRFKGKVDEFKRGLEETLIDPPVNIKVEGLTIDEQKLKEAKDEIQKEIDFIERSTLEAQRTLTGSELENRISEISEIGADSLRLLEQELVATLQTISDPAIAAEFERQIANIKQSSQDLVESGLPEVDDIVTPIDRAVNQIEGSVADSFINIIDGTKSVGAAFADLGNNIVKSLTSAAVNRAVSNIFAGGFSSGGQVPAFATGGAVRGAGTGTSDSILAKLSNGEFVMRAAAVKKIGLETLNKLNFIDKSPPKFNTGGLVNILSSMQNAIKYAPLPRFRDGGIVNSSGSQINNTQQAPIIQVINNSSAGNVKAETRLDSKGFITQIILEDIQNNGRISRGMQSGFNLKR